MMKFFNKVRRLFNPNLVFLDDILAERINLTPSEKYFSVHKFGRRGDGGYSYIDFCKLFKYLRKTNNCSAVTLSRGGLLDQSKQKNSIVVCNPEFEDAIINTSYLHDNFSLSNPSVVLFDCSVKESEVYVIKFDKDYLNNGKAINIKDKRIQLKKVIIYDDSNEKKVEENHHIPRTPTSFPNDPPETKDLRDPILREREIKRQSEKRLILTAQENTFNELEGVDNCYTVKIQRLHAINRSKDEFCDYAIKLFKDKIPLLIGDTISLKFNNCVDEKNRKVLLCTSEDGTTSMPYRGQDYPNIKIDSQKCMQEQIYDKVAAHAVSAYQEFDYPLEIKVILEEEAEEKETINGHNTLYSISFHTSEYEDILEDKFVFNLIDEFKFFTHNKLQRLISNRGDDLAYIIIRVNGKEEKINIIDESEVDYDPMDRFYEKLKNILRDSVQTGIFMSITIGWVEKK